MKTTSVVLYLLIILSGYGQGVTPNTKLQLYNRAVIWRGFDHSWTYNHRINRLGSYVYLDSLGVPRGKHFSASGLGADSTEFSCYYSYIEHPKLTFYQGCIKIILTGKESQLLTKNDEYAVYVPVWFRNKSRYKSIINGFEIKSIEKSDQPQLFLANIEDPFYSPPSKEMKFRIHFNWVGNCRSAECAIFNNTTTYELTLHYLLIGFDIDEAISFQNFNTNSYAWGIQVEHDNTSFKKRFQVLANKYNSAFIGIKSLSFALNEEQWIQSLNYRVGIDNYSMEKGEVQANLSMNMSGWHEGMKKLAASKSKAMFSHKKAGWVTMDMSSLVFQANDIRILNGSTDGTMYWKGWNKKAESEAAENNFMLKFNF